MKELLMVLGGIFLAILILAFSIQYLYGWWLMLRVGEKDRTAWMSIILPVYVVAAGYLFVFVVENAA